MKLFRVRVSGEAGNITKTWHVRASTKEDAQQLAFALAGGWGKDPHAEKLLPLAQMYCEPVENLRKKIKNKTKDNIMGNWNIIIQGTGPHHNKNPEIDANEVAEWCVKKLIEMGQTIHFASFTNGAEQQLLDEEHNTRCNPGELARFRKATSHYEKSLIEADGDIGTP